MNVQVQPYVTAARRYLPLFIAAALLGSALGACPSNRRILLAKEVRVRFCLNA